MTLLKKPSEINETLLVKGLIYGQPGIGKSTIALSAPNPVMIDADLGMRRVEKRFQTVSLPMESYELVLQLLDSNELADYGTIVIDTFGKFIDRIGDYLCRTNPKAKQGDGTLSMKGWGYLKAEFQRFLKLVESKNKNIIFVAHEKEERDGELTKIRPDVSGSSGKDLLKELDFMGYMEMKGDKRTISFTPCERFYAKNSLKLEPVINVPSTDAHPNDFIQKVILERTVERLKADEEMAVIYNQKLTDWNNLIAEVKGADSANDLLKNIKEDSAVWDSSMLAKRKLWDKAKDLGLEFNKEKAEFFQPESEQQLEAAE